MILEINRKTIMDFQDRNSYPKIEFKTLDGITVYIDNDGQVVDYEMYDKTDRILYDTDPQGFHPDPFYRSLIEHEYRIALKAMFDRSKTWNDAITIKLSASNLTWYIKN